MPNRRLGTARQGPLWLLTLVALALATTAAAITLLSAAPGFASSTVTLNPTEDAYAWSSPPPGGGQGESTQLRTGWHDISGNYRTAIRFALGQIPAGSSIESAELRLHQIGSAGSGTLIHYAYRKTTDWSENTFTWSGSGNFADKTAGRFVSTGDTGWVSWDVTTIVSKWMSVEANYGFNVAADQQFGGNTVRFHFASRESSTNRPELIVSYVAPTLVSVTVGSIPSGRTVRVDGADRVAPYATSWDSGSSHTLDVPSPQPAGEDRYVFASWNDGGAQSHAVAPISDTTYTANFTLQHFLSTRTEPGGIGIPGGGLWYDHNASAFVGPAPVQEGYAFSFWRRDGIQNIGSARTGVTVTVDAAMLVEAVYIESAPTPISVTVDSSPPGRTVRVDGSDHTAPYDTTWDSGSPHTLDVPSPQPAGSDRYVFSSWTDGGAQNHAVAPISDTTYTANLTLQHFVTTSDSPGGCGACIPGGGWHNHNSLASIGPAPTKPGYVFDRWRRDGSQNIGSDPAGVTVTVDATMLVEAVYVAEAPPVLSCSDVSEIPTVECEALVALFDAADGPNWTNNSGWLETDTPCSWHAVACDSGHVTSLDLTFNQLSGNIPAELGDLTSLTWLTLDGNELSGDIPAELGNLSNLRYLILGDNELSGGIPPQLGNLSDLSQLRVPGNKLSGSIPVELGNLSNLIWLGLNTNQLSGSIPPELGNLSNLQILQLQSNQLSGIIPAELGNLSSSNLLWLGSNQLSGSIPAELGNLSNLDELRLDRNQLSGSIPAELGALSSLILLDMSDNQLSGSIPGEVGNLSSLGFLIFDSNQLNGSIPAELGNLSNLRHLFLNSNQLSGSIPAELGNLSDLSFLYLFDNQLSGSIPVGLGNMYSLTRLLLDRNQLSGPLPQDLKELNLEQFYFADTALCEPSDAVFQAWLSSILDVQSTGVKCDEAPTCEVGVPCIHVGAIWISADSMDLVADGSVQMEGNVTVWDSLGLTSVAWLGKLSVVVIDPIEDTVLSVTHDPDNTGVFTEVGLLPIVAPLVEIAPEAGTVAWSGEVEGDTKFLLDPDDLHVWIAGDATLDVNAGLLTATGSLNDAFGGQILAAGEYETDLGASENLNVVLKGELDYDFRIGPFDFGGAAGQTLVIDPSNGRYEIGFVAGVQVTSDELAPHVTVGLAPPVSRAILSIDTAKGTAELGADGTLSIGLSVGLSGDLKIEWDPVVGDTSPNLQTIAATSTVSIGAGLGPASITYEFLEVNVFYNVEEKQLTMDSQSRIPLYTFWAPLETTGTVVVRFDPLTLDAEVVAELGPAELTGELSVGDDSVQILLTQTVELLGCPGDLCLKLEANESLAITVDGLYGSVRLDGFTFAALIKSECVLDPGLFVDSPLDCVVMDVGLDILSLAPDETVETTHDVGVGEVSATFVTTWTGSDVMTSLTTPSSLVIDRETEFPGSTHLIGPTYEVYSIPNPESGEWTASVFGADVPTEGEDVVLKISSGDLCGDINADSLVNVFDAIAVLQIIVGLADPAPSHLVRADLVRDGSINVFDAILLLQHIVGLTEITECGLPAN